MSIDLTKLSQTELLELKAQLRAVTYHRFEPVGAFNGHSMVAFIGSNSKGEEAPKKFSVRVASQVAGAIMDVVEATPEQKAKWSEYFGPIAEASSKAAASDPNGGVTKTPRLVEKRR